MEKGKKKYNIRRDFPLLKGSSGPSEEVVNGLYAQLFLEQCKLKYKREVLEREIDQALASRDQAAFNRLSAKYKLLRLQNELGMVLTEQNYNFHIYLKW